MHILVCDYFHQLVGSFKHCVHKADLTVFRFKSEAMALSLAVIRFEYWPADPMLVIEELMSPVNILDTYHPSS